jgi:hypothetical protein
MQSNNKAGSVKRKTSDGNLVTTVPRQYHLQKTSMMGKEWVLGVLLFL